MEIGDVAFCFIVPHSVSPYAEIVATKSLSKRKQPVLLLYYVFDIVHPTGAH